MLVLDGAAQLNHSLSAGRERSIELRRQELAKEIASNTITVEDDNGRNRTDLLAQMGKPMMATEFMRLLKLCNPNFIFEQSIKFPRLGGIYMEVSEKNETGAWTRRKMFITGFEWGIMPEMTVVHKTTTRVANPDLIGNRNPVRDVPWKQVPTYMDETRGWRSVLIKLLKMRLVTRLQVEQYFGWTPSVESERWAMYTQGA